METTDSRLRVDVEGDIGISFFPRHLILANHGLLSPMFVGIPIRARLPRARLYQISYNDFGTCNALVICNYAPTPRHCGVYK